jgi:hypothetical protein
VNQNLLIAATAIAQRRELQRFRLYSQCPELFSQKRILLLGSFGSLALSFGSLAFLLCPFLPRQEQVALAIPPSQPRQFCVFVVTRPNAEFYFQWRNWVVSPLVGR